RRLLFGPWLHVPPDLAAREPVDWLELLRGFFDEHLRGAPPAAAPAVLAFVQGSGGGWRGSAGWPWETRPLLLRPGVGGRLSQARVEGEDEYGAVPSVGVTAGQFDPFGTGMGYPLDQGPDDLRSLSYASEPVDLTLELAGSPEALLDVELVD